MSEIRAFLAIDLKEDLRQKVYDVEKEFKKIDADINYVEPKNLHFTLKFLGDIDEDGIDKISEKVEEVLENYEPFGINIKGCGAFPNEDHIKVLWFGTQDNVILNQLHDDLDEALNGIGFEKDDNFSTHLTFGRMKSSKCKDEVKKEIEKYKVREIGSMNIKDIRLKKSTLKPEGPIYEDLKVYKLEWFNWILPQY